MKPVFFVTGQTLPVGTPDVERREAIAQWITGHGDRWFAKAFVNRMWAELVGHGFYEPVDDIGPDRSCAAPHTLDYLAEHFANNQYDIKWLFRVILATEAYQRESRSRFESEQAPFAASCPQRLRGDQLFNSLTEVLGIGEGPVPADNPRAAMAGPRGRQPHVWVRSQLASRRSGGLNSAGVVLDECPRIGAHAQGPRPRDFVGAPVGPDAGRRIRGRGVVFAQLRASRRKPKCKPAWTIYAPQNAWRRSRTFCGR